MKIIGLTGGIGSGKTTVSKIFSELGAPVYIADEASRRIASLPEVQGKIIRMFGKSVEDNDGTVDRGKLAALVFSDPLRLGELNALIHPLVQADFQQWANSQRFPFVIKEAAILFESGSFRDCDKVITVTAPTEVRIERVMARDNISRERVLDRIANQWPDERKIKQSDFVVENVDVAKTTEQIRKIFTELQHL